MIPAASQESGSRASSGAHLIDDREIPMSINARFSAAC